MVLHSNKSTAYADATWTRWNGAYVVARYPDYADTSWVEELRRLGNTDELHGVQSFVSLRQADRALRARVDLGVSNATVFVIDVNRVRGGLWLHFANEGCIPDLQMPTPVFFRHCAAHILAQSPLADLPRRICSIDPLCTTQELESIRGFSVRELVHQCHGRVKHAAVLAARGDAMFEAPTLRALETRIGDAFTSLRSPEILNEVVHARHRFDRELPKSIPILQRAHDVLAESLHSLQLSGEHTPDAQAIAELDSRESPHLQAADFAAAIAREIIGESGFSGLTRRFNYVWLDGRRI